MQYYNWVNLSPPQKRSKHQKELKRFKREKMADDLMGEKRGRTFMTSSAGRAAPGFPGGFPPVNKMLFGNVKFKF